ncbi:demethoxyubiquinone hydroxylase family protein [Tahibacter sp.]|uniref:demethoxyubiquinone hydroxylase family protein n=1 Tax=Tahibacter sp. TaxID=2056211 RepID=UPI0028C4C3B1|nr:demethoxyubiquinone hydroxylase family protein [Tahibacter sp.]
MWPADIQRTIRVNQSGEFGAIGIYQAQHWIARLTWPQGMALIDEMLAHEREHLAIFSTLLERRGIRSCYALGLWRIGGWSLGAITALFGRNGILICTRSVETTVLAHLAEQRQRIGARDPELIAAIAAIEQQEREHRDHGAALSTPPGPALRLIEAMASRVTAFAISLSMRL